MLSRIPLAAFLVLLAAQPAATQTLQDCYNGVGVFTTPTPTAEGLDDEVSYLGPAGAFELYVVLINPRNEQTGEPIANLGGFEFRVDWPDSWFVTPELPAGMTNALEGENFACSGPPLPVVHGRCLLMTLSCGTFTEDPQLFFITQVLAPATPVLADDIAVLDADAGMAPSRATPVSFAFDAPVFSAFSMTWPFAGHGPAAPQWCDWSAVPDHAASWGDVKAIYR